MLIVGASCSSGQEGKPRLTVNGREVGIGAKTWRVSDALEAGGVTLRGGMYKAVISGRLLEPNGNAASLTMDGDPVTPSTRVHPGSSIKASDGADTVEPVEDRLAYGDPPALPPVVTSLWHPGRGPVEQQSVGKLSGEV